MEHTVTEEVTSIDVVQTQLRIAGGASLDDIGLKQESIQPRGVAIQCRITTENAERNFAPDTGTISVYRHSSGFGMRQDGIGYSGLTITPYYDSLLVKYTARGASFEETLLRMRRALQVRHLTAISLQPSPAMTFAHRSCGSSLALQEARIRGVQTNIPFLLNVLTHPVFETGIVTTSFIDENPSLLAISSSTWNFASAAQVRYLPAISPQSPYNLPAISPPSPPDH